MRFVTVLLAKNEMSAQSYFSKEGARAENENTGLTMPIPSRSLFRVVSHSSKIEFQQN